MTAPRHGIIRINESTEPGCWNAGNALVNAETLLHELGRVYDVIRGSGGSQIKPPDVGPFWSKNDLYNDWLIDSTCFGGALGLQKP